MMSTDARNEMVALLRGTNEHGAATAFHVLLKEATPADLRDAIRECSLTPNATCCNRRRMGQLANELIGRVIDGVSDALKWENRALDAEKSLAALRQKLAAEAPPQPAEKPAKKGRRKR